MLLVINLIKLLSNFARFYNFNFFVLISLGLYKASALSNVLCWKVLMNGVIRMTSTDCKQYLYHALAVGHQPLLCIALHTFRNILHYRIPILLLTLANPILSLSLSVYRIAVLLYFSSF
jgi:hypothetical protein